MLCFHQRNNPILYPDFTLHKTKSRQDYTMVRNISKQPPTNSSTLSSSSSDPHSQQADSRDIIQHLKNLDDQERTTSPERYARIEKGKQRRTYGFGRFACFCLSGGN